MVTCSVRIAKDGKVAAVSLSRRDRLPPPLDECLMSTLKGAVFQPLSQDEIVIVPVKEIASIVADGEILRLTTAQNENYTIAYRLKDLGARLDPARFVRLGRGTLANLEMVRRVSPMPGGTYIATLSNGQRLSISRLQGRILREHLLKL